MRGGAQIERSCQGADPLPRLTSSDGRDVPPCSQVFAAPNTGRPDSAVWIDCPRARVAQRTSPSWRPRCGGRSSAERGPLLAANVLHCSSLPCCPLCPCRPRPVQPCATVESACVAIARPWSIQAPTHGSSSTQGRRRSPLYRCEWECRSGSHVCSAAPPWWLASLGAFGERLELSVPARFPSPSEPAPGPAGASPGPSFPTIQTRSTLPARGTWDGMRD